jgi:integrase
MKQRKKTIAAIRYVSIQEYHKLINASNPWWRALIAIAYGGGLRREEILNLIWQDIDFEKKQIHIQAKSNSSNLLDWEPKDHENRIIPITDQAIKLLTDLFANSIEGHPYVFVSPARLKILKTRKKKNPWDQTPDTVNNIMRQFEGILKKVGIAKCTLHDLRRSAITNWAQHLPVQVVQNLAGHSNITTTRKYYLAVLEEDMTKASKVINAILQPAKTD